jgi:TIR domain
MLRRDIRAGERPVRGRHVADIFVSYTNSDRDWAFWIGQELERLGHIPHIHEWEIDAGGNIAAWMQERHDNADHTLCVISKAYLSQPYSSWELQAAQWAAASGRPNFALPVFVEDCKAPTMLAPFKRCDLFGLNEDDTRARFEAYLKPAAKPSGSARFPGGGESAKTPLRRPEAAAFPGNRAALSNIPISVPRHVLGRDDALAEIDKELKRDEGHAPQIIKGASSLRRVERGPMLRLITIGAFAIGALGVIAWLLADLQFGTSVKTGNCGIGANRTATGNSVNCGSTGAVEQHTNGTNSPAQSGNGNTVIINGKP